MTSEQIRQKAREFDWDSRKYKWENLAAFAESLPSGGADYPTLKERHQEPFGTTDIFGSDLDDAVFPEPPTAEAECNCNAMALSGNGPMPQNCDDPNCQYFAGAARPAASPQPAELHSIPPKSSTYGDLPAVLRGMIQPHEWDNMNFSEQRDWAIAKLAAASGSGSPATPSTPKLRPQVPEWDYESQHEREKAIIALQEEREHQAIVAAVAAEREECAKIAEQYLDSAFCKGSFYGQQVAAAIRSRAPQPAKPAEGPAAKEGK